MIFSWKNCCCKYS